MSKIDFKVATRAFAQARAQQRAPDFTRFEPSVWTTAADRMVQAGDLEGAASAVRWMRQAWPALEWARNVDRLLQLMPPPDPAAPPFADDSSAGVQTVHRPGAETTLLVFCGANQRVGMPLPMLHRWLSRFPVSLIYLRDLKSLGYLNGVEPLGQDLAGTLAGLRRRIAELGTRRTVCYGPSFGGYGALRYGLELGVGAVVLMSGLINMEAAFNEGLHYTRTARRMQAAFPEEILDLRELYLASPKPPVVFAAYAEHNWDDRIHAEHLIGLDGVVPIQAPGAKTHNTTMELMRTGRFDDLIREAIEVGHEAH